MTLEGPPGWSPTSGVALGTLPLAEIHPAILGPPGVDSGVFWGFPESSRRDPGGPGVAQLIPSTVCLRRCSVGTAGGAQWVLGIQSPEGRARLRRSMDVATPDVAAI